MYIVWLRAEPIFPLDSGNRIRSFNLLRGVAREEAVTYVGLRHDDGLVGQISSQFASPAITVRQLIEQRTGYRFYARLLANLGSAYPYYMKRYASLEIRDEVRKLVQSGACDLIVCDSLESAVNLDFDLDVPKVLYHHAVETTLWHQRYETASGVIRRAYFNFETKRMAAYESMTCNRFDHIIATSENDRESLIKEHRVTSPITPVPVGVDSGYFKPPKEDMTVPRRLMFSGSLDLLSNIDQLLWFVSEVYPLVRREHPDASLEIVGPNPAVEIATLPRKDQSIRVAGWVKDIRPHLAQADIYIVPLRVPGGNRVKLYEAMAMRRPVVSTSYGAEGLNLVPEQHLLVADTVKEFAAAVNSLLRDTGKKSRLAEAGYRLVHQEHDWSRMVAETLQLLRSLSRRPAHAGK
ncbi:MAG: glycosyltransferase family 4 protein [candidate division Zixibacteria bacterium]|nr:glycosyltransferase family 4 protein [candidate division Zixibacteria bacterium]